MRFFKKQEEACKSRELSNTLDNFLQDEERNFCFPSDIEQKDVSESDINLDELWFTLSTMFFQLEGRFYFAKFGIRRWEYMSDRNQYTLQFDGNVIVDQTFSESGLENTKVHFKQLIPYVCYFQEYIKDLEKRYEEKRTEENKRLKKIRLEEEKQKGKEVLKQFRNMICK